MKNPISKAIKFTWKAGILAAFLVIIVVRSLFEVGKYRYISLKWDRYVSQLVKKSGW